MSNLLKAGTALAAMLSATSATAEKPAKIVSKEQCRTFEEKTDKIACYKQLQEQRLAERTAKEAELAAIRAENEKLETAIAGMNKVAEMQERPDQERD